MHAETRKIFDIIIGETVPSRLPSLSVLPRTYICKVDMTLWPKFLYWSSLGLTAHKLLMIRAVGRLERRAAFHLKVCLKKGTPFRILSLTWGKTGLHGGSCLNPKNDYWTEVFTFCAALPYPTNLRKELRWVIELKCTGVRERERVTTTDRNTRPTYVYWSSPVHAFVNKYTCRILNK